ncbi:MAG: methyltransferase domain-containing protein [Anaerolineae bacterium]|nr:methyltransferase domain-containing protein [Anaerolineae bacterium]
MGLAPVVSWVQLKPLAAAWKRGEPAVSLSLDLNLSQSSGELSDDGMHLEAGLLPWDAIQDVLDDENGCFELLSTGNDGLLKPDKIQVFSPATRRHCSLYPTETSAPTLLIAGFPMHRIKDTDPMLDTKAKIRAADPRGVLLDTSMGLGYTAIAAAKRAQRVITLELDPAVMEVAQRNPWSLELFSLPNIERRLGDSSELIDEFDDAMFDRILHDPPTLALAGDLYSGAYYRELYRLLKRGGRLFHYIGDLNSPSGQRTSRGVIERLGAAGFRNIAKRPEAFGVIGFK